MLFDPKKIKKINSLVAAPKVSQSNRRKDGKDVNKQTMVKQKSTKSKPPNHLLKMKLKK